MRKLSALLLLILIPSLCDAQIFRRRYNVCPDCQPQPYIPSTVPFVPVPNPDPETKPAPVSTDPNLDIVNEIIPPEVRVRNPNVQCAWVAGEEVFVAAGYPQFKGWGEAAAKTHQWHGADMENIIAGLKSQGVDCKSTRNHDLSIFDYAKAEGVGVYVQIPGHALVCALLTDTTAYMVNNYDDPKLSQRIQKWTRSRFLREWTGVGCCPLFNKRKKPKEPIPTVTPSQPRPAEPTKPIDKPAEPVASGCKCPPPQDLSKITDGLNRLVDSVTVVNKSVGTLSDKVSTIDQRLTTAEGKLANSSPVGQLPPPSAVVPDPRIQEVQDKLAKLEANLKQSGTLHITATPK